MYPTNTHFLQYKGAFLGRRNNVFGFIKESHAQKVLEKMTYDTPVIRISEKSYVVNRRLPRCRLIDKRYLHIFTQHTTVGQFFTMINNTNLILIDEVVIQKNRDVITLISNYEVEEMMPIDTHDYTHHLGNVYNKQPGESIDYVNEMANIIIEKCIDETQEDNGYDFE
jgi:hypothetical protein